MQKAIPFMLPMPEKVTSQVTSDRRPKERNYPNGTLHKVNIKPKRK